MTTQTQPLVIQHAAFELSPAAYDEITRRLRNRGFHHLFDTEHGCIFMQYIALTRAPDAQPDFIAAWVLENGKSGDAHRYMQIDEHGRPFPSASLTENVPRFARKEDADSFIRLVSHYFMSGDTWAAVPHVWG